MFITIILFILASTSVVEAHHRHHHHHHRFDRTWGPPWYHPVNPQRQRSSMRGRWLGHSEYIAPNVYAEAWVYHPEDFEFYHNRGDPPPDLKPSHYYTRFGGRYYFSQRPRK